MEIITASPRFPRVVDGVVTTVRCDADTCTVRSAVGVRSSGWTAAVHRPHRYNHWGKLQFVFTASVLVFTASLCSSDSCCVLGFPSTFPSPFCAFTAGAAVAQWGNQRNLHLRLGPVPPEEKREPPLLASPMVAGGDQKRGRAISASFASGA